MKKLTVFLIKLTLLIVFFWLVWLHFDAAAFADGWISLVEQPLLLAAMTAAYAAAFVLKAVAWRLYLPPDDRPPTAILWHGLIYSLLINHVLPVKAGDVARVGVLWRRGGVPPALAMHSVVAMRALDLAALGLLAAAGAPLLLGGDAAPAYVYAAAAALAAAALALGLRYAERFPWAAAQRHAAIARAALRGARGAAIATLTLASWILEAAVVFAAAAAMLSPGALHMLEAVWANALTIAGGPAYIGPGGIGGYESTMSFALQRTGLGWSDALMVALLSHSFKFMFSYAAGFITILQLPIRRSEWRDSFARRKEPVPWTE